MCESVQEGNNQQDDHVEWSQTNSMHCKAEYIRKKQLPHNLQDLQIAFFPF